MKTIISLLTTMVFVLAFGTAFADEWPTDKSHLFLGTEQLEKVTVVESGSMGAAAGGLRAEGIDKSAVILESLFGNYESTDVVDPYRAFAKHETAGVMGAAAGGLRAEAADKGSEIFDSLLGSRGSKTDTNIAY